LTTRASLLLATAVALLATAPAESQTRWGIEAHGGIALYSMGAMNDSLASFNREFGTDLGSIEDGATFGAAIRLWPRSHHLFRLAWEHLSAKSEASGVTVNLNAEAITFGLTWFTPPESPVRFGLGLAMGPYFSTGAIEGSEAALDGSGVGLGVLPTAEVLLRLSGAVSVNGAVGYRWASIGLEFDGRETKLDAAYDGVFLRLALAVEGPDEFRPLTTSSR
jgi:hypothetical protein